MEYGVSIYQTFQITKTQTILDLDTFSLLSTNSPNIHGEYL